MLCQYHNAGGFTIVEPTATQFSCLVVQYITPALPSNGQKLPSAG